MVSGARLEDDDALDGVAADFEGCVHDVLEGDVTSGAVGDVGGEYEAGAACLNAVAERARAEAGEYGRCVSRRCGRWRALA